MTSEESKIWREGRDHAHRMLAVELMNTYSGDKLYFIEQLRAAAHAKGTPEWDAYSEALRHVTNILKSAANPKATYENITKNSMPMDVSNLPHVN